LGEDIGLAHVAVPLRLVGLRQEELNALDQVLIVCT
jgi:hypothetical protein